MQHETGCMATWAYSYINGTCMSSKGILLSSWIDIHIEYKTTRLRIQCTSCSRRRRKANNGLRPSSAVIMWVNTCVSIVAQGQTRCHEISGDEISGDGLTYNVTTITIFFSPVMKYLTMKYLTMVGFITATTIVFNAIRKIRS